MHTTHGIGTLPKIRLLSYPPRLAESIPLAIPYGLFIRADADQAA